MAVNIIDVFSPAKTFPTLGDLVNVLVRNIFVVAGVLLFLLLIFGGFQVIVKAGNEPEEAAKGKNAMTAALIGFALIFAAYWIAQILQIIFGVGILGGW